MEYMYGWAVCLKSFRLRFQIAYLILFFLKRTPAFDMPRRAGLRLTIHDHTGQLGVVFVPQTIETLNIKIGIADLEIAKIPIRRGISAEFAPAILEEAITTVNEISFLGAGILEFNHGGFDPVYSSERIFRLLTKGVLSLLDPDLESAQDEQILARLADIW